MLRKEVEDFQDAEKVGKLKEKLAEGSLDLIK